MVIENEVYKKNSEFLETVSKAKHDLEKKIAEALGFDSVSELRRKISFANRENRSILLELANKMKEEGKSTREIAIELGKTESSVRLLLSDYPNSIPFEEVQKEMDEFRKTHETIPIIVEVEKA